MKKRILFIILILFTYSKLNSSYEKSEKYTDREKAVFGYTSEMTKNIIVSNQTYDNLEKYCSDKEIIEITYISASENFISYKTLANGAMRTSFELDYAPWKIDNEKSIKTTKKVSLDIGSQLSRIEVNVEGADLIVAGLTLQENDGIVTVDSLGGWVSYYQPHGDSQLATALVASPGTFVGYEKVESEHKDEYLPLSIITKENIMYCDY